MNCRFLHGKCKACAAAATSTSSIVEDAMKNIYIDRQREKEKNEWVRHHPSNTKTKTAVETEKVRAYVCMRVEGIVIASAIERKRKKNVRERKEKEKE